MKRFSLLLKSSLVFMTLTITSFFPLSYTFASSKNTETEKLFNLKDSLAKSKSNIDHIQKFSNDKKNNSKQKEEIEELHKRLIFQPLVKYDSSELKNQSDSPIVDKERYLHHLTFIWSLWRIINSTLWVDQVYGLPWIESIEGVFPETIFNREGINISINHEAHPYKTERVEEKDYLQRAKKVKAYISKEDIQGMKAPETQDRVIQLRQNMSSVFSSFFLLDWEPKEELSQWNYEKTVKTFFATFSTPIVEDNVFLSSSPKRELKTLRFIRKYQNRFYYLDINFNVRKTGNSLMVQYIWYKDIAWYKGGYYQANGEYNNYRDQIGGDINSAKSQGLPTNNLDEEFQKVFENIYSRPDILYKFVLTIKNCLEFPECSLLFHRRKNDYFTLSQRDPGISSTDSHDREKYKHIHPFSKKYYEAEKVVSENPPAQFLFPIDIVENTNPFIKN